MSPASQKLLSELIGTAPPDRGQVVVDLALGQPAPVVGERERAGRVVGGDPDDPRGRLIALRLDASLDGVVCVLDHLSDEDVGLGVEALGEQVDQARQVDLDLVPRYGFAFTLGHDMCWA